LKNLWTYIAFSIHRNRGKDNSHNFYATGKKLYQTKITTKRLIRDILLISAGVLSAGFGLRGFILPNNFIDGGAVGISLLIAEVSSWPLPLLLIIVNAPFIFLGATNIGKDFALKTGLGILALALAVAFIPYPEITDDKLLVAVFGGFFLGMGIGLAVRGGGVIDGTEVLAINLSKKTDLTIGDIILILNIIIFSVGAYLLSVETALYSILTYLAASKTIDFIIEGIEEYTGVTIVSYKADEIQRVITQTLKRGVTIYKGERVFFEEGEQHRDTNVIYTVITRLEVNKLNTEIAKIDPNAFVVMNRVKDTKGGIIKKRRLKH